MNIKLVFLRNPFFKWAIRMGFTDLMLDFYWGRNDRGQWERVENTGYMARPKSIWFEPTMRCNLNCIFCHQNERRKYKIREMSLEEINVFLEKARAENINLIEMIGGEIFVRNDIFDILDLVEDKGMRIKLGTNGILLDDNSIAKLMKYRCIESIAVSVDGPPHVHNTLRNSPVAFEKATGLLKKLGHNPNFATVMYSVLLPENLESVPFLVTLARELKVDRLTFMPEMFYSRKDISATREYLNLKEEEKLYVEVREGIDLEEYVKKVLSVLKMIDKSRKKEMVFVPVFPRISRKYPRSFFKGEINTEKKLICRHFYSLTVIENGDVLLCPFIHRKIGNVLEDEIEELWNNNIIRELRREILQRNMLPICRRCCALDYL